MKKIIAILCCLFICIFVLSSCGNYEMIDFEYGFEYAIVELPGGETKVIELDGWTDFEGEQIQLREKETGNVYLVSSYNCILVKGDYKDLTGD